MVDRICPFVGEKMKWSLVGLRKKIPPILSRVKNAFRKNILRIFSMVNQNDSDIDPPHKKEKKLDKPKIYKVKRRQYPFFLASFKTDVDLKSSCFDWSIFFITSPPQMLNLFLKVNL